MSRIARWKLGTSEPRRANLWAWRSDFGPAQRPDAEGPKARQRRWIAVIVSLAVYLSLAGALVALLPQPYKGFVVLLNLPFYLWNSIKLARQMPKAIVGEGPGDSVWVSVSIQNSSGWQTGSDQGWLIHCDGWLLFEGERTSFSVSRGEARSVRYEPGLVCLEDERRVRFSVPGEKPDPTPLEQIFAGWNQSPIPEGEAVLPPVEPHPEVWTERQAMAATTAIACLVMAFMAFHFESILLGALLSTLALGLVVVAGYCVRTFRTEFAKAFGDATTNMDASTAKRLGP